VQSSDSGSKKGERAGVPPLGAKVRRWRTERGLSIAALARASGLSSGFLSQMERDLAMPSLATIVHICEVLDVPVAELFEQPQTSLVRRDERRAADYGPLGIKEWMLSPGRQSAFQVIESEIEPGADSGSEAIALQSEAEWVYVLLGQIEVTVGGEPYRLRRGDSLTLSPPEPYSWRNPSSARRCRTLWVIVPAAVWRTKTVRRRPA
jgi:transcriptional regulator with XRE-family HTH domain